MVQIPVISGIYEPSWFTSADARIPFQNTAIADVPTATRHRKHRVATLL
jgi:hypothetical protein